MIMRKLALIILSLVTLTSQAQTFTVKSPAGKVGITVSVSGGGFLEYSVTADGKEVIDPSITGFAANEWHIPVVASIAKEGGMKKVRSEWKPVWGKRSTVPERYNEQDFSVEFCDCNARLEVRAYDEGAAFRLVRQEAGVFYEWTEFNFSDDFTAWYYNGENHNIGPEKLTEADGERWPIMTVKAADDLYLAIHEACLGTDGWPMNLRTYKGSKQFKVIQNKIETGSPYTSAWRVVMCANTPGGLVDSHLLELLNPEATGDWSWVKPGVDLWDWRIDGAVWDGYHYGMNYESWVKMIDFAAEEGFRNLVLDANWYGPEFAKSSDPTKGDKAREVQDIIRYGKEKGVGVWLYLNDVAGINYPIEETLAQYEQWGAAGVKYGFMNGNPLEKNRRTQKLTALCAQHHLMIDFHDYPVHPFGQMRTWPNAVTREFCKAQLDGRQIFYPKTFVTSVFVNMVSGPVDMNNGFMELHQGRTTRKDNNQEVPTTATGEIARTLITWSGATVIPDIPEYYRKYPQLLEFLSAEKQPWQESVTLDGEIGKYVVMMRRNADGDYLVAAATDEEAREITIPLSFLPKNTVWKATVNTDAASTDFRTERETFVNYRMKADSQTSITLRLAPGGGACILLKK